MKHLFLLLLFGVFPFFAYGQDKVMRVHSSGSVVYAANTSQVDSVTFQDGTLPEPLINTKWKLNGIVDTETGAVAELEPKECRDCYTLSFGTDYTAIAIRKCSPLLLDLLNLGIYKISDQILLRPEWDEESNKNLEAFEYRRAIAEAESCTATEDELRLYYNDKRSYLQFEPFIKNANEELNDLITSNLSKKGVADPALLIGEWDFITYAYTDDGITISEIPTEPGGRLQIKSTKANSYESRWECTYWNTIDFECSLSGNLVKLGFYSTTYLGSWSLEEERLEKGIEGAYSFVIDGDKLLIYFTGASDENILIFKKR